MRAVETEIDERSDVPRRLTFAGTPMRLASISDRLTTLDGLRGFAILLVIWYHLWLVSGYVVPLPGPFAALSQNGFLGVDLFFFVSGFCICYPYARARHDGLPSPTLRNFVRKRLLKIVPSYVLALLVFALVYRTHFSSPLDEFGDLAAHLAFVHTFYFPYFGAFSGPLWTLGIEMQFYVVFAVLAPWIRKRPLTLYASFVICALAYRFTLMLFGVDGDFGWVNQLPGVIDVFGAGMMTAFAYVAVRDGTRPDPRIATAIAVVAAAVMLGGLHGVDAARALGDDAMHRWLNLWRTAIGPSLLAFTLGVIFGFPALRTFVTLRPLAFLSTISYNAYLWNLEVAVAVANLGLPPPVIFVLAGTMTILVSAGLTYAFERPIVRGGLEHLRDAVARRIVAGSFVGGGRSRAGEA